MKRPINFNSNSKSKSNSIEPIFIKKYTGHMPSEVTKLYPSLSDVFLKELSDEVNKHLVGKNKIAQRDGGLID